VQPQRKKQRKAINNEDKLYAINRLGEDKRVVDICRAPEFAKTAVCTIRYNAEKSYHVALT
jgi:hypothetical protein